MWHQKDVHCELKMTVFNKNDNTDLQVIENKKSLLTMQLSAASFTLDH